jgi:hypothetical protein
MRTRSGFGQLRPLIPIAGPAAGAFALLASARPMQSPEPRPLALTHCSATVPCVAEPLLGSRHCGCRGASVDTGRHPGARGAD